ncbi:uncharacterized protein LOC130904015 [Diorhabda carinulata]|uniref:uncharacterized protein LOC130895496 n=1 Tax=Diorhabda carinulata TaxID=1163345 RepID=UPI0025A026B4|nr:uncharacterized protein LOC130895496 [Diorhabda carinulata]XP_057660650.1 uncharacterized protein LOC130896508 [Diorhabda carinulata]XP_057662388.1 uncharacterized protein LOC130897508 [Diorhabda carinulata]XP_057663504.1 uncharacterized protein LOC130898313 [Diorhabda carinulata]XP_057665763.1 uncharacterized protein LOC130899663 [Diorhabda carinulata]XP_057667320.1 uncharacterized protein LOC130900618 [Diorhabda carinulata]XP_057672489.1 uncharacterized protein LOC130904015 [Diorhabda ca
MSTDNSTSNDDVSEVVADYKYRLVVFVGKKKKKDIDIVPSSWIFYDEKTDTIKCKFMPPPYDVKRSDTLSKMVQNCEQPINDWPVYSVDIRGRARTFEEANELAIQLEYKPFAYSTQNEETAKVKAANDVHFFKNRKTFRDESLKMLNEINIDLGEKTRVNRAQPSSQKLPTEEDKQDRYYSSTDSDEEHCYDASRSKKKKIITRKNIKRSRISSSSTSDSNLKIDENNPQTPNVMEKLDKNCQPVLLCSSTNQHSIEKIEGDQFEKLYRMIDARFKTFSNEISEKFTKLNSQYNSLSLQIGQLSGKIIEIQHQLTKNNINNTDIEVDSDDENAEIKLPCKTKIDFDQFDEKLEKDKNFHKKIPTLRKVFSKPGEDVPDQNILDAMASALHNCKDWDGGRTARSKKPAEANSEIDNEHLD